MAKPLISLRLDERLVRSAQKVLKTKSRTQTIEMSLEAVVELNTHRRLIERYSGPARLAKAGPGDECGRWGQEISARATACPGNNESAGKRNSGRTRPGTGGCEQP
jgi:hypothetical protein